MNALGIIPARFASSRFPGKPLAKIAGIPMLKRTFTQAKKAKLLSDVLVATDSKEIMDFCKKESIKAALTSQNCQCGTDRLAEISQNLKADFYINIQGDEPIINPNCIDEIITLAINFPHYHAFNLYKICNSTQAKRDTIIKMILNKDDELLYASRFPIPFSKSAKIPIFYNQVCVYAFTQEALKCYGADKQKSKNEKYEDIEILRLLDLGFKVKMKEVSYESIAVDIPSDIELVEEYLKKHTKKR
ncbi:MAG: 3-deoxy-manno-octulosonate cytidylyltransferase [Helicobacter sp.]|nr:3-deoxy-manno-octulosonate cytidylyltransferase [Helicobacteraceae bacterium]MDY3114313.1 3-deoxy-manno-octulosonate cytidylyltransferase [Helicobacter sp.]